MADGRLDFWERDPRFESALADDVTFAAFEEKYGVRLPDSFKEMYRIQNGGLLADVESPEFLLPIGASNSPGLGEQIGPLTSWLQYSEMITKDGIEWITEEFGNPAKIFPISSEGHVFYTLDFNRTDSTGEPFVVYLDFEGPSGETVAPSFSQWINRLTASNTECAIQWDERTQHPILFQESVTITFPDGSPPEVIEQCLCRHGEQGLLLFRRIQSKGRVSELHRVALPHGVDGALLSLSEVGEGQRRMQKLHLYPADANDIHWVMSKQSKKSMWKHEWSSGVPVYCDLKSKNEGALRNLATDLRQSCIAH